MALASKKMMDGTGAKAAKLAYVGQRKGQNTYG